MKRIFYSLLALFAPLSTISADNAVPEGEAVGIVAHRGYWNCEAGGRARNSLAAFKAAHEAGFWGTEFDVNMTADGELIVFHDETLRGKRIDHTDWAEIADHRLENGETIPRLDEFLAYANRQKNFPMLVFELKGHITEELQDRAVALTIEKLKRYGMFEPSKVMFISFHPRQCRLLAEAAPGFTVQYLGKNVTTDDLLDNRINGIDTYYKSLLEDPEWLRLARNHGFSVNTWTVDAADDMRKVLALHIDQLTTDEPELARKVLAEEGIRELTRSDETKPAKAKTAKKLKKRLTAGDYVLCYAGGEQAKYYDKKWVKDFVTYTDRDGKEHWLFDGFLFLQIKDFGAGVAFDPGHKDHDGNVLQAAAQSDWMKLIDYYFEPGQCLDAIEQAVGEAAERIGAPGYKRQVIISIPNPIPFKNPLAKTGGSTYWGVLDGKVADMTKAEDRFGACKWYIDEVLKRYRKQKYKYVDLVGFYYVTEETSGAGTLMTDLSAYLHAKGYPFTWIPYYNAPGWNLWKEKGFDFAWYQPNYFFNAWLPEERLVSACKRAIAYGMAMEMEFDERAAADRPNSLGERLRGYMEAYKKYGSWEKLPIAYYQSSHGLHTLKYSENPKDTELYQDFCDFVAKRPLRKKLSKTNK